MAFIGKCLWILEIYKKNLLFNLHFCFSFCSLWLHVFVFLIFCPHFICKNTYRVIHSGKYSFEIHIFFVNTKILELSWSINVLYMVFGNKNCNFIINKKIYILQLIGWHSLKINSKISRTIKYPNLTVIKWLQIVIPQNPTPRSHWKHWVSSYLDWVVFPSLCVFGRNDLRPLFTECVRLILYFFCSLLF